MLFNGEEVGDGHGPAVDVAVDPLEGTRLTALGQPNAIAVIALAERGTMFFPGAAVYMEKIATGPEAIGAIDITATPRENVQRVAQAKGKRPSDVHVVVLERDRHEELIAELREAGCKVHLIRDGDVAPSIAAAQPRTGRRHALRDRRHARGRDLGRGAQVRRRRDPGPALAAERRRAPELVEAGLDLGRVLHTDDLVAGDDVFVAATGVTGGRASARRPLPAGRRDHRLDRDALPLRDRPPDRGARTRSRSSNASGPRVPLSLRRARIGVAAAFAAHGVVWGTFSSRLPALKHSARRVAYAVGALLAVLAGGTVAFHQSLHESWMQSTYRTVVTISLAGLDTVPNNDSARAGLDRARARRADYLCLHRDRPRRGDRERRLHGRVWRAEEETHDRALERPLHHLRLRPGRPPHRRRVPRGGRPLRRARLQPGGDRGRARAEPALRRGQRHRGRGPRGGRARAGDRPRRLVRLGRRQPLHHALGAQRAARPADRRARLRRGRGQEAAPRRRRPRRAAVLDRRQGDGEARPAAAGGRLPRHRLDERRPRAAVRGDRGQGVAAARPASRSATCASASRPAR